MAWDMALGRVLSRRLGGTVRLGLVVFFTLPGDGLNWRALPPARAQMPSREHLDDLIRATAPAERARRLAVQLYLHDLSIAMTHRRALPSLPLRVALITTSAAPGVHVPTSLRLRVSALRRLRALVESCEQRRVGSLPVAPGSSVPQRRARAAPAAGFARAPTGCDAGQDARPRAQAFPAAAAVRPARRRPMTRSRATTDRDARVRVVQA